MDYGPMEYVDGHWQKIFKESRILDKKMGLTLGLARESMKEHLLKILLDYIQPGATYKISLGERIDNTVELGEKVTMALIIVLEESSRK